MSEAVIVTAADLEEALTGFRLGVRRDNGDHEGATVSAPAVVADVLMRTLSRRFAEKLQGPPVVIPPPPGDRELHAMATISGMLTRCLVSREDLAEALDHQWVYAANRDGTHHGQVVNPVEAAGELWEKLAAKFAEKLQGPPVVIPPPPGDRELHAMATISDMLTGLDNPDAVSRILRYFNDRYGDGGE